MNRRQHVPDLEAITRPTYSTKWVLSKDEPIEAILKRFERGGLIAAMATPPKVVKLGASQVRQPPRMKIQVQDVEDIIKSSVEKKKKDEPITEDKKAEQKNDEKKSPARKKVKMRKRKQREKEADLSDQLREEQETAEAKK